MIPMTIEQGVAHCVISVLTDLDKTSAGLFAAFAIQHFSRPRPLVVDLSQGNIVVTTEGVNELLKAHNKNARAGYPMAVVTGDNDTIPKILERLEVPSPFFVVETMEDAVRMIQVKSGPLLKD